MTVVWSPRAVRHLTSLRSHIARDSPSAAARVAEKILGSVELLSQQPNLGRQGRIAGTRELVIPDTPYVIPYRVRAGRLELIAVFHGSQRWPNKL